MRSPLASRGKHQRNLLQRLLAYPRQLPPTQRTPRRRTPPPPPRPHRRMRRRPERRRCPMSALPIPAPGPTLVLPFVWAFAPSPEPPVVLPPEPARPPQPVEEELAFYRKYTEALLRRYARMSMEAGRVP